MDVLPIFMALRDRPVLLVGTGEAADAKRRLIEAAGGIVVDAPRPGVQLAFVAIDDEALAAAEAARLRALGMVVNVVDKPALCDFNVPAIVDRSPVVIAVGTGGASASLAKAIRQRLEAMLPAGLGAVATAVRDARDALKARWPDAAGRRRALDAAMSEDGPLDPFGGAGPAAVAQLLTSDPAALPARVVIDLRSADPDDLTLREARWLARADTLVCAPGVPVAILDRARRDAARVTEGNATDAPGLTVVIRHGSVAMSETAGQR